MVGPAPSLMPGAGRRAGRTGAAKGVSQDKPHTAGTLCLSEDLLRRLRPHAARRALKCNSLAMMILDTVVEQGLVDAVLDDGRTS